jgi:hypothetical protein
MRSLRSTFFSPVLLSIVTASLLVCGIGGCGNEVNVVENANPAVCGSSVKAVAAPTQSLSAYTGVVFGGEALAGKQPLAGASVELYAAPDTCARRLPRRSMLWHVAGRRGRPHRATARWFC